MFFQGLPDCHPRIVVIGALGRCGKGALDMAYKVGIPRYTGVSPVTRLSGHFSIVGLVFFGLKSLLGTARQWSHEKFAILTLKPHILVI